MIWPFFGPLSLASGTVLERLILMKKTVSVKLYQSASFLAIVLVMLPFLPFFWKISSDFYTIKNILIFASVVVLSLLANYFTFYSMKYERLGKLESAKITEPLFVILIAFIFSFIFGQELYGRNPNILVPALVAAAALIFSHVKKHHLKLSKYYIAALAGSFFFASELITSRLILDYFNPITFYFLRCATILIASSIIMRPKLHNNLDSRTVLKILGVGIIWFAYRIIIYFGYTSLGVVETTLTIMLGPILIYLFAWKFLKEKLTWKQILTGVIVLAAVAYAIFI